MADSTQPNALEGVAVVGLAGRFPGAASAEAFWQNLAAGVESITRFSREELEAAGIDARWLDNPDFVAARGLVAEPERFDAAFFGISQREAELMDPQQRLFLETCWHALEHAGVAPGAFDGAIGVWGGLSTGMSNNTYLLSNLHAAGPLEPEDVLPAMLGNENDYLTTRVSYKLNLRGPSVNVQSACSTSLVAIAQACQALVSWQCDAALAGGVSVSYPQQDGYLYQEGGIGSPDGHCRAFDARAEGTVFSNGVGAVVLRRLEDAVADGQTIYAVIRGWATNNDGASKVSFAAPSVEGQADVIATAMASADVEPDTIDYVEAHGTGTPLGDPIEVAALTRAYRTAGATGTGYCGLGSVKTNVGHLDSAAGVAGFIKTVLALHHRTLPPSLHFDVPNPKCQLPTSPFYVVSRAAEWPRRGHRRRAAVSSFGIGGTNAHIVLEEAPDSVHGVGVPRSSELVVVSAKTTTALEASCQQLAAFLEGHTEASLADVAWTLRVGRQPMKHRRAVVGASSPEIASRLRGQDNKATVSGVAAEGARAVAFLFPGGGTQYVDMARGLLRHAPVFREAIDACFGQLGAAPDIRRAVFPETDADRADAAARLELPSWGLPALFAVEYALARQWMAWGIQPNALLGHSMGEYTAACLAGVMSLEHALALVALRGRLFETLPEGGMVGVPLSESEVEPYLGAGLAIAAVNAPSSLVVSGAPDRLAAFTRAMGEAGIDCRRLHIAVAAHSPMVEPILAEFEAFLRTVPLAAPTIPVVSNVTGTWLTAGEATSPAYWAAHLRQTVRFADGLATLFAEPNRVLVEAGPGQALTTFARQHPSRRADQLVQPSLRHPKESVPDLAFAQLAMGRLWASGVSLDWPLVADPARRVALPLYPFDRQRFLIEPPRAAAHPPASAVPAAPATAVPDTRDRGGKPVLMTPPVAPAPAAPARPRADRVCDRLIEILHKLSGVPVGEIDPTVSFLEMGFDSLFLTQASLKFKAEFGVRITFRQLFEDAPTLQALAVYIDGKMPADKFPAPVAAAPATSTGVAPASLSASTVGAPAAAGTVERVIQDQLRIMADQLRLLRGEGAVGESAVATAAAAIALTPSDAASSIDPHVAPAGPMQFGPFRGIDKSQQELTPHQRAALDRLVERYTAKTAKSKALTESQRARLADPRAVSGFRKTWKELVYQIATVRSAGSLMWDLDGNEYIDVTSGFGVNLFGYAVPEVNQAIAAQVAAGIELGTLSPLAREAADLICDITGMERASFANTGSEAISGAIRAVRTITGREWIAVFDDEYHGIAEEVLVKSIGQRGTWQSAPAAPGIPEHLVDKVLVLHYDDPRSLDVLRERADEIAGVIIEPVQNRHPDFRPIDVIRQVRAVTAEHGIPLIFDEMITGFRLHKRGAQGYFGIDVDVACYGKVMSGGLPIAAVAGKAEYLDAFDGGPWRFGDDSYPEGGVTFFGGTYTRNVLSLASAVAALRKVEGMTDEAYVALNAKSDRLADRINTLFETYGAPIRLEHCGSVCNILYRDENPLLRLLCYYLREKGIHIWDRPFFISFAHTEEQLSAIVRAFDASLAEMKAARFFGDDPPPGGGGGPGGRTGTDVVPMTEPQVEVWLAGQMSESTATSFNESVAIELCGALDVSAFERAVAQVVARHEALRMTVSDDPLGFRVRPDMVVPVAVDDLRALEPEAIDARVDEVIREADTARFDLARGPLLRVRLVQRAADDHVLVLTAHHVVCDGWSFGVVLHDLAVIYSAFRTRASPALEPPMAASDYAALARSEASTSEAATARAFWSAQFDSIPEPLQLPADRSRPLTRAVHGARIGIQVSPAAAKAVKAFATRERVTLFTALLGVFEALVYRLSGQDDFVVGIPIAAQAALENPNLVAHAVNFIPLRCRIEAHTPFSAHLSTLRSQAFDISEHQNFTYRSLLTDLRIPRNVSRDPLVSVSFTVEPPITELPFDQLRTRLMTVPRSTSKRDLHVNVMDQPEGLLIEADFSRDLFDEATVRRWLGVFERLMTAVVETPDRPIDELPLGGPDLQRAVVETWNRTDQPLDVSRPVHVLAEEWAARTPTALAVSSVSVQWTWEALNLRANQVARELVARGVVPRSIVAVALQRSPEFIVALLAAHKAGCAYVPIDPTFPDQRVRLIVADSGARLLLTTAEFARRAHEWSVATVELDTDASAIARHAGTNLDLPTDLDDVAYLIYTSGSTGVPKGVAVEHRPLLNYIGAVGERIGVGLGAGYAFVSTVAADLGLTSVFPPLATGGTIHVLGPDEAVDPRAMADYFTRHRVDVLKITPSHLASLIEAGGEAGVLPRVCLVLAGEPLRPSLVARVRALAPGLRIINSYGPTETTVGAITFDVDGDLSRFEGRSVPIGRPMANIRAYVLDAARAHVPVGVAGELYIGGAGVARGYIGREDLTRERFLSDPFSDRVGARMYRTGDRARWLADGTIEFLGRFDDQVKILGFRIELGEVETALRALPGIADAVVLARADARGEDRLVAYTLGRSVSADDLRAGLARHLPRHAVPSAFVAMERWPLNANGKIDRKAFPAPAAPDASVVAVAPTTDTERRLADVWCELLEVSTVHADDDFFLLGGHSLLAIRLVHRVHQVFDLALAPGALIEYSTLGALAAHIDRKRAATMPTGGVPGAEAAPVVSDDAVLVKIAEGGSGTPFFWVHGVGGEVFSYLKVSQHLAPKRPVYGFAADWTRTFEPAERTIDRIATRYIAEMRAVQPRGPYHLGGFCSAAVLVLEIARQLEEAGDQIGAFAVLDYDVVGPTKGAPFKKALAFARNLPRWVQEDAALSGPMELLGRVRSRLRRGVMRNGGATDIRDQTGMWRFPDHQVEMLRVHHAVIHSFTPRPIRGQVTLFLPRTGPLFGPWPSATYDPEWSTIALGGVATMQVRGSHSTMLVEPFASELGGLVSRVIGDAEARLAATSSREPQALGISA